MVKEKKKRNHRQPVSRNFSIPKFHPQLIRQKLTRESTLTQIYSIFNRKGYIDNEHTHEFLVDITEKKISMQIWEGCTSESWVENRLAWQRLNNVVIKYVNQVKTGAVELMEDGNPEPVRVEPKRFVFGRVTKNGVTKLCKLDRATANAVLDKGKNTATTLIMKGVGLNDNMDLGRNYLKEVAEGSIDKLPGGMTEPQRLVAIEDIKTSFNQGIEVEESRIVNRLKGILESNPVVEDRDNEMNDGLTRGREDRK